MFKMLNSPNVPKKAEAASEAAELTEKKAEIMESGKKERMSLMMQVGSFMGKLQEVKESFWNGFVKALESMGLPTAQAEKFLYVAKGSLDSEDVNNPSGQGMMGPVELYEEALRGPLLKTENLPFTVPAKYKMTLTGHFGDPRPGHTHAGVDLAMPEGTPVVVPANKAPLKVLAVESGGSGGNELIYRCADGTRVVLSHLQYKPNFQPGDRLEAGTVMGFVGQTGRASGPHIHMEIGEPKQKIDPLEGHVDQQLLA
jgi:murein DD-endopeptidase MepM/ murein hydrolase activator NlpD